MAVPLPQVSSIAQAKEYASAAMKASKTVCPAGYNRYKECYDSAVVYEQQKIANSPFEGDAVRVLVDMLNSANGFCHDVRVTGTSNPPARTVTGNEPAPMSTQTTTKPPATTVPPKTSTGTTYKPATSAPSTPGSSGGASWLLWGGLAFLAVWLLKKKGK